MRRASIFVAFAALLVIVLVAVTYTSRRENDIRRHKYVAPVISLSEQGLALKGWKYDKDDPQTNHPMVRAIAASFRLTHDPSVFELHGLALKLFAKKDNTYTYVKADAAHFDERSGVLTSTGPVSLVMNVPVDKDVENKDELAKRVRVQTSGVTYETKTQKAHTDQPAAFLFPDGSGKSVGVEYDPNTKTMHLRSQVTLDRNGMHVETSDLVYREAEQKIYLSPWSKLQRGSMTIQAKNAVVFLEDRRIHQIEAEQPAGVDDRKGKHVEYSAEHMTAHFDADGNMTEVQGDRNARVVSTQERAKTVITGDQADLHFLQAAKAKNGKEVPESYLNQVVAQGHAVAESSPVERPGIAPSQTRVLRSERIDLDMKPGGQEVREIRTPGKAQLEFKPNRPDQVHRLLDAARMNIIYGDHSYIDRFMGWNAVTRTDKPATPGQKHPPAPAYTWSDYLAAAFVPNSSEIAFLEQRGNFRYQEGPRKASSNKAILEQKLNRITLIDRAKVSDDTGATTGELIVMDQNTGDMDVTGKVFSVRTPEKGQKPGSSMLDQAQPLQAKADKMQTRNDNFQILYDGHVVMWQGANRITADKIDIDRDAETLHAVGHVISELVDNKKPAEQDPAGKAVAPTPVYTTVKAPDLVYRDDTREALYSGGVTLLRNSMTVTSAELRAYLTPKTDDKSADSSLDHAFADGNVCVLNVLSPNHKRTGTADRGEYYTREDKVVLKGGAPQIVDSLRGITKGEQITYFSATDRLLVEGEANKLAFTKLRKK